MLLHLTIFLVMLCFLKFLSLDKSGKSAAQRLWHYDNKTVRPMVRWKDPIEGRWHGPDPVLIWGRVVFSRRMPKSHSGSRKGWYARQRLSLVEQMRPLRIQETAPLPTAQQIQALLQMACENSPNLPTASPTNILVSLLLLLNQISYMNAVVFWAYVCS